MHFWSNSIELISGVFCVTDDRYSELRKTGNWCYILWNLVLLSDLPLAWLPGVSVAPSFMAVLIVYSIAGPRLFPFARWSRGTWRELELMTYLKSLKPQQVMSPASRLVLCATSQQVSKNDAKDRNKKGTKAVKTKRRWREKKRPGKRINNLYTPFVASLQASERPHHRRNPSATAKIAKNDSRPPKSYLFFQNFQCEPP